jgi:hypothetical protein
MAISATRVGEKDAIFGVSLGHPCLLPDMGVCHTSCTPTNSSPPLFAFFFFFCSHCKRKRGACEAPLGIDGLFLHPEPCAVRSTASLSGNRPRLREAAKSAGESETPHDAHQQERRERGTAKETAHRTTKKMMPPAPGHAELQSVGSGGTPGANELWGSGSLCNAGLWTTTCRRGIDASATGGLPSC